MNHSQDLSKKIRPFLNALERGIDSARQQRLTNEHGRSPDQTPDDTPTRQQSAEQPNRHHAERDTAQPPGRNDAGPNPRSAADADTGFDPTRIKARPKRPAPHQGSIPPRSEPADINSGENNHRHAG